MELKDSGLYDPTALGGRGPRCGNQGACVCGPFNKRSKLQEEIYRILWKDEEDRTRAKFIRT